jgi:hypothetical protein
LEQHLNAFAIRDGKLKAILDTEEVITQSGWPGVNDFKQRSRFTVASSPGSQGGNLNEIRCTNDDGKVSIEKRDFNWDASKFRLTPAPFVDVSGNGEVGGFCK